MGVVRKQGLRKFETIRGRKQKGARDKGRTISGRKQKKLVYLSKEKNSLWLIFGMSPRYF